MTCASAPIKCGHAPVLPSEWRALILGEELRCLVAPIWESECRNLVRCVQGEMCLRTAVANPEAMHRLQARACLHPVPSPDRYPCHEACTVCIEPAKRAAPCRPRWVP